MPVVYIDRPKTLGERYFSPVATITGLVVKIDATVFQVAGVDYPLTEDVEYTVVGTPDNDCGLMAYLVQNKTNQEVDLFVDEYDPAVEHPYRFEGTDLEPITLVYAARIPAGVVDMEPVDVKVYRYL